MIFFIKKFQKLKFRTNLNNDMKAYFVYFNEAKSPKLKVQLWRSNATKLVMFNFPPYLLRNSATWERKMKLPGSEFILLYLFGSTFQA